MSRRGQSVDRASLFLEYGVDLDTRTIYLGSFSDDEGGEAGVDYQLASQVIRGLLLLDSITIEKPITLIINNAGGDDEHCLAIYDCISQCQAQVVGKVFGVANSAAAWILQACDVRLMAPHASLMVHSGETGISTNHINSIDRTYQHIRRMENKFLDILLERIRGRHPDYTRAKVRRLIQFDRYLLPEEAIEMGLADGITS